MPKKEIRSANKAVIIQNGKLLTLRKEDEKGSFYTLPGGGQEHGETAHEGLIRECIEEISVTVKPEKLLFVRDYIGENHEIKADILESIHQLELIFLCSITEGSPQNGTMIDNGQLSIDWIDLNNIEETRFYPAVIKQYLKNAEALNETIYLGDAN